MNYVYIKRLLVWLLLGVFIIEASLFAMMRRSPLPLDVASIEGEHPFMQGQPSVPSNRKPGNSPELGPDAFPVPVSSSNQKIGTIVLIIGTSSVGKTTLTKELFFILRNNEESMGRWGNARLDDISDEDFGAYEKEKNKRSLKPNSKIPEYLSTETYALAKAVCIALKKNSKVLCDTVIDSQKELSWFKGQFQKYEIITVLLYCPLLDYIDRVASRNRNVDTREHRLLQQPVLTFSEMYSTIPSPDSGGRPNSAPVGSVFPEDIPFLCKTPLMEQSFVGSRFGVLTQEERVRVRQGQAHMGFSVTSAIGLDKRELRTPIFSRLDFDLVIDTNALNQEETIKKVLNFIRGNSEEST